MSPTIKHSAVRFLTLAIATFAITPFIATASAQQLASADLNTQKQDYKRPESIPFPDYNPYTPEKAALGKMLYFDPRVSAGQNMTCASCHNPSFGWEAPLARAIGSQNTPLGRHAPTVLNMAFATDVYFWDGRADTLEEQAKGPIQADVEMNMPLDQLVTRLSGVEGYQSWFARVFPDEGITEDTIVAAIATYERTVVSSYAPFDAWVDGDEKAISDSAKRGFKLFTGKAECSACHTGWNFTDNQFHDIGLPSEDIGRANVDPSSIKNWHAFKTPGLRDTTQRLPFMHNGSVPDLEAVILHYASGGIQRPSLSEKMKPLDLSDQDVEDLIAFVESLTGEATVVALPRLPN
tara:strand:+ start:114661 stop:115710 length:1050 start_codon:yes stop_codon:yes gene_type:complete